MCFANSSTFYTINAEGERGMQKNALANYLYSTLEYIFPLDRKVHFKAKFIVTFALSYTQ
jgi:hypothetical protein